MGIVKKFTNWLHFLGGNQNYIHYINNGLPIPFTDNKQAILEEGYLTNEIVYSIINKISTVSSSVPIELVDENNEVVTGHWTEPLLNRANNSTSFIDLLKQIAIYKYSVGDAYIYKPTLEAGMNKGKTNSMYILPADQIEIVAGDSIDEPIAYYKLISGNTEQRFEAEDVLHLKFFNPKFSQTNWALYGLSPVKVAADVIQAINNGNTAVNAAFANGSPPYMISAKTDEGWTEDQKSQVAQVHKEKYGGANQFGKPMILGTPVDVQMLGLSPVDLGIISQSEHGLRVLCNVMGNVPSVLFNDTGASTYNNVEAAEKAFYQNVIIPHNKDIATNLTYWLLSAEPKLKFRFNYSDISILQDDISTKINSIRNAYFLTPNEQRESIGYEPIEDADMDNIYLPFGLQPAANNTKSDKVREFLKL